MEAEYKKDMNHNFMILKEQGEEKIKTTCYQVRMLIGNSIPHLLPCQLRGMDGEMLFYYEITSLQPITVSFEKKKLGQEDLREIFAGSIQVLDALEEYLLDPDSLVMDPGFIYRSAQDGAFYFCYFPGYRRGIWEQIQRLTEYLLPKIDHEDNEAVTLGYTVYRQAMEADFTLDQMKQTLYESGTCHREESQEALQEEMEERVFLREEDVTFQWEEPEKKQSPLFPGIVYLCILAVSTAVFIGMAFLQRNGYLPWMNLTMILEAVLLVGIFAMAGTFFYRTYKKGKNAESLKTRETEETIKKEPKEEEPQEKEITKEEDPLQTTVLYEGETDRASFVSSQPERYKTIYLQQELTIVGKMESASDVVIPLPTISRVHAKVRKRNGEYYLTDLNSRNGTSVNGVLLNGEEEYLLKHQDQVSFADADYIFWKT